MNKISPALSFQVAAPARPAARVGVPAEEPVRDGFQAGEGPAARVPVAGFHDLRKMSPELAEKSGLDLKGVEWIADDFDSETC